jgi:hypothetical protein
VATKKAQQPSAPTETRSADTQSGVSSRISTALNRNEQPQTAPMKTISAQ